MNSRLLLIAGAATAVIVALIGVLELSSNAVDAGSTGTGPGSSELIALDMDPTGNTATSLGDVQTCAHIEENGILDADEEATPDTVVFDLTITNIPAGNPMISFYADLEYNETALTMQQVDLGSSLLGFNAMSALFPGSSTVPDTDGDGFFVVSALDTGTGVPESGTGVLARVAVSSDDGAAAGQYDFKFRVASDVRQSFHTDDDGNPWVSLQNNTAAISINQPCGSVATLTPAPTPPPTTPGSPTATPGTPTVTPTGGPTDTPTPTPSATATPTPTGPTPTPCVGKECPTPTPVVTATPAPTFAKGDLQCDGDVDSVDALMALRYIAGLDTFQEDGCPPIGTIAARQIGGAGSNIFGDINCNGSVDAVDPLFILRHIAGLSVNMPSGCDPIGS